MTPPPKPASQSEVAVSLNANDILIASRSVLRMMVATRKRIGNHSIVWEKKLGSETVAWLDQAFVWGCDNCPYAMDYFGWVWNHCLRVELKLAMPADFPDYPVSVLEELIARLSRKEQEERYR